MVRDLAQGRMASVSSGAGLGGGEQGPNRERLDFGDSVEGLGDFLVSGESSCDGVRLDPTGRVCLDQWPSWTC